MIKSGEIQADFTAASYARVCQKLISQGDAKFAQRMLATCWMRISPILANEVMLHPRGETAASIIFIESYFCHEGDWARMEENLLKGLRARVPPDIIERSLARICQDVSGLIAHLKESAR